MKLGYSEFSFGYAFTENMVRDSVERPSGAPVFPNLRQEAQLGYDVRVDYPGVPVFFQFKLPDLMMRRSAKEIATLQLPGLSIPFFRMPLMKRDQSDQHIHLINLEKKFRGAVFYATPLLKNNITFNAAYCKASVHRRSGLFSPSEIGPLTDNGSHSVAYKSSSTRAWHCSEPKEITLNTYDNLERTLADRLKMCEDTDFANSVEKVKQVIYRRLPGSLRMAENYFRDRLSERFAANEEKFADESKSGDDNADQARRVMIDLMVVRRLVRIGLGVDLLMAQLKS